jgi:hypothetical protein
MSMRGFRFGQRQIRRSLSSGMFYCVVLYVVLTTEEVQFSEKSVSIYQTTRLEMPEDSHRDGNEKSDFKKAKRPCNTNIFSQK